MGLALLLKSFELEERLPESDDEIPPAAMDFVAGLGAGGVVGFAHFEAINP